MRNLLFVLSSFLLMSCQNEADVHIKAVEEKVIDIESACIKCDKAIIDTLILHSSWYQEFDEVQQFLCALDSSCEWSEVILPWEFEWVTPQGDTLKQMTSAISYNDMAREILMVGFYHNFSKYMEIFEANRNLNRNYIFSRMIYEAEEDLPYNGILDSLNSYSPNTEVKRHLVQIFEDNIKRFQR